MGNSRDESDDKKGQAINRHASDLEFMYSFDNPMFLYYTFNKLFMLFFRVKPCEDLEALIYLSLFWREILLKWVGVEQVSLQYKILSTFPLVEPVKYSR